MSTRSKFKNGILSFFDGTTHENVAPLAPVVFYDDFIGADTIIPAGGSEESGSKWSKKIVGAGPPTVAGVADAANGVAQCALTSASQKQDAGLYMGDQRQFSVTQGLVFETRVKLSVLPTLVAEAVIGLVGDWTDGLDAITYSAFFTADGDGAIVCEADDNATDSSVAAGVTATNAQWKIYRIDFSDVTNVKFYIDGNRVGGGTTIPYAATGANAILQPYIGLHKASGTGLGTIQCDYVRIWQNRS